MDTLTVAILTMSSKNGGYCVAGIDMKSGHWVRLVTGDADTDGALTLRDLTDDGGNLCKVLDVVKVSVQRTVPTPMQPENVLIDRSAPLRLVRRATLTDVTRMHPWDYAHYVFANAEPFVQVGVMADPAVGYSLIMVWVENLMLTQTTNRAGKPKTLARFRYNGVNYLDIYMTDPEHYDDPDGTSWRYAKLVLSLANQPLYDGKHYKFIAKIFEKAADVRTEATAT